MPKRHFKTPADVWKRNIPKVHEKPEYNKEKRDKVISGIKNYYKTIIISQTIRDTEVDYSRLYTTRNVMRGGKVVKVPDVYLGKDYFEVQRIYKKYNMKQYSSKEEFMLAKDVYTLSDAQKETLWIEYQHRDELIRTGQYEEIRLRMFKENYIIGLERLGATPEEIEQVRNLTDTEIDRLMFPQADKTNPNKKLLPELGLFEYNNKESLARVRRDLGKVFKEQLGKEYKYEDDTSNAPDKIKKIRRLVKPEDRDDIDDTGDDLRTYYSMIDLVPVSRIKHTKPDKYGHFYYYIPFFGSERSNAIVREIVARKKKLKLL